MPFTSGRVSFIRFRVVGDAPSQVDETMLAALAEHSFRQTNIGAPSEVEAGFVTGDHLFDTQFTYEKIGFVIPFFVAHFAIRIDTHKVPSEIKHAYKRMNESALAQNNPSGFATKSQKKEAFETAERQIHEDLKSGKFRKSKLVPVLWDLNHGEIYLGASTGNIVEQLARLMREAFNLQLEEITPGAIAGWSLRSGGDSLNYENLRPSAFTKPPESPDSTDTDLGSVPLVPWMQSATSLKDFLGNEFLLWIWWNIDRGESLIDVPDPENESKKHAIAVVINSGIKVECAWSISGKDTIHADNPTRSPEAREALAMGKWPRQAGLTIAHTGTNEQWSMAIQVDKWAITGASLPEATEAESMREVTAARLAFTINLARTLDALLMEFIKLRTSPNWPEVRSEIRNWISANK
jgi:hypothetical protein